MMVFVLLIIYRNRIDFKDRLTKISAVIVLVFILILVTTFLSGQTNRLSAMSYFAYQRTDEKIQLISKEDGLEIGSLQFQFLHGEWFEYVKGLMERYLIYFSPKMLFIDGDYSERHSVPDLGVLYFFSIALIPLGLFTLIKSWGQSSKPIIFWLLLAPIPAVLSRDLISTLRALNMVIPYAILEGMGLIFLIEILKKHVRNFFLPIIISIFLVFSFNFLIYLDRYFIHAPKEYSKSWLFGYRQVVESLPNDLSKYDKVVFTDTYGQPYIYYLFYKKYPPSDFQKQAVLDQPTVDVGTVRKINNIEFRHVYWPSDRGIKASLFIGSLEELPDKDVIPFNEFKILNDFYFLNGEHAFRVVETK